MSYTCAAFAAPAESEQPDGQEADASQSAESAGLEALATVSTAQPDRPP